MERSVEFASNMKSGTGSTRTSGSGAGTWVATCVNVKVCEFGQRNERGVDIPFAMQWWSRIKPLMKEDLRAKCGEVRAKVTTHMYKVEIPVEPHFCSAVRTELNLVVTGNPNISQINFQFPAITVESSPERSPL